MTQIKSSLMTILLSLIILWNFSCQKEVIKDKTMPEESTVASGKKPDHPGFAENDMVMYWNEKASIVLGAPMPQPSRTRYFAMIQIAVHDALNNIKPKFDRYSLDERTQH